MALTTKELIDAAIWGTDLGSQDDEGILVRIDPIDLMIESGEDRAELASELARSLALHLGAAASRPDKLDIRQAARVAAGIQRLLSYRAAE